MLELDELIFLGVMATLINDFQDPSAASMAGGGMDRHNASPDIGVDPDDYRVAHLYHNCFCL